MVVALVLAEAVNLALRFKVANDEIDYIKDLRIGYRICFQLRKSVGRGVSEQIEQLFFGALKRLTDSAPAADEANVKSV